MQAQYIPIKGLFIAVFMIICLHQTCMLLLLCIVTHCQYIVLFAEGKDCSLMSVVHALGESLCSGTVVTEAEINTMCLSCIDDCHLQHFSIHQKSNIIQPMLFIQSDLQEELDLSDLSVTGLTLLITRLPVAPQIGLMQQSSCDNQLDRFRYTRFAILVKDREGCMYDYAFQDSCVF